MPKIIVSPNREEPWDDLYASRLGVKLTPNALGWALIKPDPNVTLTGSGRKKVRKGQHVEAALAKWEADGCPSVEMYKYANWLAFLAAPDKAGMSLDEHSALVDLVAAKLRRRGAKVTIKVISE